MKLLLLLLGGLLLLGYQIGPLQIAFYYIKIFDTQGSKLTFLLGSTGAPNFKKLGAPQLF